MKHTYRYKIYIYNHIMYDTGLKIIVGRVIYPSGYLFEGGEGWCTTI